MAMAMTEPSLFEAQVQATLQQVLEPSRKVELEGREHRFWHLRVPLSSTFQARLGTVQLGRRPVAGLDA